VPLAQLLAFSAFSAWCHGMEPENGAYEEWEFDRILAAVKARKK
jgi:hypothetical protein